MKKIINLHLKAAALALMFLLTFPAYGAEPKSVSAKDDYVTCWKQPCVLAEGSKWSEQNPNGVAVSIRMEMKSAATDDQLKNVILSDLKYYKVEKIQFFYEQNDVPASIFFLHVRGGTEGPFLIGDIRGKIQAIAERALNTNPIFHDS